MKVKKKEKSSQKLLHLNDNHKFGGLLSENIMHFARILRRTGLAVGSEQVLDAIAAVIRIGLSNRTDFYWALHAVFVKRIDQREIFDQVFHIFWRNPKILERMMGLALTDVSGLNNKSTESENILRRVAEALSTNNNPSNVEKDRKMEFDSTLTWSPDELIKEKDFEKMSTEEIQLAVMALQRMQLPIPFIGTRRFKASNNGVKIDMRNTMRASLRSGSDFIPLIKRECRKRRPPLVVICDISGSMERYSRMLLHFMHAVTNHRDRVYTFLFGTTLTNVTPYLRYRDVDEALEKVGAATTDWSGGTRIGHSLYNFNKFWSRRVLTHGAIVIFISDGLDRDEGEGLHCEMQRLHRSCRRLIWLNPLLRYKDFKPKSFGIKAILPHVDEFKTIHNLNSFEALVDILQDNKNQPNSNWNNRDD